MAGRDNALFYFEFGTDDLGSAGDNTVVFHCPTRIHVREIGIFVTTDLVPGAASAEVGTFRVTTASIRDADDDTEGTAPSQESEATATAAGRDVAVVLNQTVPDGRVISKVVDFTLEKGEQVTFTVSGDATSGTGFPYIVGNYAGQSDQEDGELKAENSGSPISGQDVT